MSLSRMVLKLLAKQDKDFLEDLVRSEHEEIRKENRTHFMSYVIGLGAVVGLVVATYGITSERIDQTNQRIDSNMKQNYELIYDLQEKQITLYEEIINKLDLYSANK